MEKWQVFWYFFANDKDRFFCWLFVFFLVEKNRVFFWVVFEGFSSLFDMKQLLLRGLNSWKPFVLKR